VTNAFGVVRRDSELGGGVGDQTGVGDEDGQAESVMMTWSRSTGTRRSFRC